MKRWLLFIFIVAPVLYLLAYGLTRNPRDLPSALLGKPAPDFSLQTLDGKTVTLDSLKGKPAVINFWATWCGPCLYEHPVLKSAHETYEKEGVQFLGVVYQDEMENVSSFIKELGEPFQVLLDPKSKMAIDYGIGGVPETFFVDTQGVIQNKYSGVLTSDYLKDQIKHLK